MMPPTPRLGEKATLAEECEFERLENKLLALCRRHASPLTVREVALELCALLERLGWAKREVRFIKGELCPNCGAERLKVDAPNTLNDSDDSNRLRVLCDCWHAFALDLK